MQTDTGEAASEHELLGVLIRRLLRNHKGRGASRCKCSAIAHLREPTSLQPLLPLSVMLVGGASRCMHKTLLDSRLPAATSQPAAFVSPISDGPRALEQASEKKLASCQQGAIP